ncbi:MAG: tRNA dihydrouridine synthase DusB [Clostridia bacterium]|nr:tRNA dihydrouridine synthase DusB [Clostridia bacterium]
MGFKLRDIEFKYGLSLAPMAGYSDRAMRLLALEHGAEYSVTEMVSARAVVYRDKKTARLAKIRADEGRVMLQLFGSEPEIMAEAATLLSSGVPEDGCVPPFAIDINMGCPVNKIFNNGEGSALMRSPEKIEKIVSAVAAATVLPVSVKLRLGIDREHISAVECALAAEAGGAELVTVHGRTRSEMYSGCADMALVAEVVSALRIPVVANGDINGGEAALRALRETGASGIAVGRGAVGNPFVFSEIVAALSGGEFTPPTERERAQTALRHVALAVEDKGERVAIPESRGQIAAYIRSFRGAAALRGKINSAATYAELCEILLSTIS